MRADEAIAFLERFVLEQGLNDLQAMVFTRSWDGETYGQMADGSEYSKDHLKHVGSDLWHLLSTHLGEKVTKGNIQSALRRYIAQSSDPIPSSSPDSRSDPPDP